MKDYLVRSRAPRYSVLFTLPLLILYELLSAALSGSAIAGVRNGADVLLKSLFVALGGRDGLFLFGLAILVGGGALVWRDRHAAGERLEPRVFGFMLLESAAYASIIGAVIGWLTALVLGGPRTLSSGDGAALDLQTQLVVSLGAGVYEELLFRVLLVGLLAWAVRAVTGASRTVSALAAIVLSALIFSGFHYVGELGDAFTLSSFTFRAIAGLAFSALYVVRGFGIAAWTHALYDLGLAILGGW